MYNLNTRYGIIFLEILFNFLLGFFNFLFSHKNKNNLKIYNIIFHFIII